MAKKQGLRDIDWFTMLIPLAVMIALSALCIALPGQSSLVVTRLRAFLGDELGFYYILLGLGIFLCSLFIAFSRYGKITLGGGKPQYSSFAWGSMIFTSTMAADILYWSLIEWAYYAGEPHVQALGVQDWASTYPLFHWGPIPWSVYIILAAAFGFMLHVRGRTKQKFSEAVRPLLGRRVDGFWGKLIDLIAVFALLAGTATTFSMATPLLSKAVTSVLPVGDNAVTTIVILILIAFTYTLTVLFGFKGISRLATACVWLFFVMAAYFLFLGGETIYILETGIGAVGRLAQNLIGMSTELDPLRVTSFPQNWTVFYWAYWMAWCVATPFFIGVISRGRTIRNLILGGYFWGLAGTFTSFIVFGNYGLAQQMRGTVDAAGMLQAGKNASDIIVSLIRTLPASDLVLVILIAAMIAFYATTFDALTIVVSAYSLKRLDAAAEPDKRLRVYWSALFILLPIGLIFSEKTLSVLQSVSIIAAFPIGIVILLIVWSFFLSAKQYLDQTGGASSHPYSPAQSEPHEGIPGNSA
jgi:BCCT family betaine/carnitine transporter